MHQQTMRKLVGAITVAALAGASATLTSSPAQALTARSRTIHLVEKGGGLELVDNPPKAKHPYDFSAGDIVIVSRDIYSPTGSRAGTLRLVCVATDQTTQQCNGTETLVGGTLEVAGVSTPAPGTTVAVIGGTGAYRGARGISTSQDRKTNSNIADQTIALQP